MPYVDQGEPKQAKPLPPILPIVAVVVAMGVGFGSFWFLYKAGVHQLLPIFLTGPLVGLALRLTNKGTLPKAGMIAIVASLVACLAGYVFRHAVLITWLDGFGNPMDPQPGVGNAFQWLLSSDLVSLLCIGVSSYFAFAIGAAFPDQPTAPPQPPQA